MFSPIAVRPAAPDDILVLDRRYPEHESRHQLRAGLQDAGEGVYLVAWVDDEPAGWVFVYRPGSGQASARARTLAAAEICDLQVQPARRGAGVGRALMETAERRARDAGWPSIGLAVTVANPNNAVAREMYRRRGYRDSGLGTFVDGYVYWDAEGRPRWDGEPHRYLVKRLAPPQTA